MHEDTTTMPQLFCGRTLWQGREAYELGNGLIRLLTLTGGGHVAAFRFEPSSGLPALSPLWVPPWRTIDPDRYREAVHAVKYGPPLEGKLLSGLAGHNICLDYFGSPSSEEVKHGLSQHGEAPNSRWRKTNSHAGSRRAELTLDVNLPIAGLAFTRTISLRAKESVAYFEETIANQRKADHIFHWTQHVTLGPLFLSRADSTIAISASARGQTFPDAYDEGKSLLRTGQDFRWPLAPAVDGKSLDLSRPFLKRGRGFVVGVLLDPIRDLGFVTALNSSQRLLIGYCFRRQDFPWVAVWEENQAIAASPWKRRTKARGLEFGSNPFPVRRRDSFRLGSLFGMPTFTCVPAKSKVKARYIAFLAHVPENFGLVRDVRMASKEVVVTGSGSRGELRLKATGLAASGMSNSR
jgi:hypothetical protein